MNSSVIIPDPQKLSKPEYSLKGDMFGKGEWINQVTGEVKRWMVPDPDGIPEDLKRIPQWIVWRYEPDGNRSAKWPYDAGTEKKVPKDEPLINSVSDFRTAWGVFKKSLDYLGEDTPFHGIGFVLTEESGRVCVDLDHCVTKRELDRELDSEFKTTDAIKPQEIITILDSYTEVSTSGTGLHVFVAAVKNYEDCKPSGIEIYSKSHYIAITGRNWPETPTTINTRQNELKNVEDILRPPGKVYTGGDGWREEPTGLSDDEIVEKLQHHEVAALLWNGDFDGVDRLRAKNPDNKEFPSPSEYDMALCGHLAFYTGRVAEQMLRVFLRSALGQREKAAEKAKTYTIPEACRRQKKVYKGSKKRAEVTLAPKETRMVLTSNLLAHDVIFAGWFAYDEMSHRIVSRVALPWRDHPGPWVDSDYAELRYTIEERFGFPVSRDILTDAVTRTANKYAFNPLVDELNALIWDGVQRIDDWVVRYLGAKPEPHLQAMGKIWLVGAVARGLSPGIKFDHMLVLEGDPDIGKSTALSILGGDYFADSLPPLTSNNHTELQHYLQGKWIIEMSELDSMRKAASEQLKSFISRQEDEFRAPYGKTYQAYPRTCVLAGSTNEEHYLSDLTGNRRFWPLKCGFIDLAALRQDRNQLFAEAIVYYHDHPLDWWIVPHLDKVKEEQASRLKEDPWIEIIEGLISDNSGEFIPSQKIYRWLGLNHEKQTPQVASKVSRIMKSLGWKAWRVWIGGEKLRGFKPIE